MDKIFTERHHAFISATFYKLLTEQFGQQGENVFVMATQRYAEQRGSRMAQRAIRDGKPLDFKSYCEYGEWEYTKETVDEISSMGKTQIEVQSYAPDYEYYVHACPWNLQYKDMGMLDAADVYCKHLDYAIARGFNPYLDFRTERTMHKGGYCGFILKGAGLDKDKPIEHLEKNMRGFDYHCAHVYYTFSEIATSILGAKGAVIAANVLAAFIDKYGSDMADTIVSFRNTDFNTI